MEAVHSALARLSRQEDAQVAGGTAENLKMADFVRDHVITMTLTNEM